MDIQITPRKNEGAERLLEVSVPADAVKAAEDRAARRYASQVRLPGFRPGKAPAAMVRKKFAQAIRQEAIEALLQEAYREVLERENLKPIAQPHVHDLKFDEGQPLTFELHLEVRPEIALTKVEGFRVEKKQHTVGDDEVAEQVEALREQRALWQPVEDRPMPGDRVTVEIASTDDAGAMSQSQTVPIELGDGKIIPGIEELVMEAQPGGAAVERPVRFPDNPDGTAGPTKTVRVSVKDVKRKALPELDDAFSREVGDFDSLDALRAAVRDDLQKHVDREADAEVRQKLLDEIIGANPFEVPASWVAQVANAYGEMYQVPPEQREQFMGEFRPMAERQVRRDLVISTIAEREHLVATEGELDERIAEVARNRNQDPGQLYASLQKASRLNEIEQSLTEEKVFRWLMEKNTVE